MRLFGIAKAEQPDRLDIALEAIGQLALKTKDQLSRFTLQWSEECPIPVWVTSEDDTVIYINAAYEREFNKTYSSFVGNNGKGSWPQEVSDRFAIESRHIRSQKRSIYFTETLNGKKYFVVKYPVNGNKVGGFCIPMDLIEAADERWRAV